MAVKISAVVNTFNEADVLGRALKSVGWADEIIVCDMHSEDNSAEIAKKAGARVVKCERADAVEKVRNFALSEAKGEWILIIDPDEEIPAALARNLRQIAGGTKEIDYVKIARKNIIFGKFIKHAGWWPDYNIRFFRKGKVSWGSEIHRPPQASGEGLDLAAEEERAIIHHSYSSVSQFLKRMTRYTDVQAAELEKQGYKFKWQDLFEKPLGEFLSRYFAFEGYKDGVHGLALSLLQAFSHLSVYLKLWEMGKFQEREISPEEIKNQIQKSTCVINYWLGKIKGKGFFAKLFKGR